MGNILKKQLLLICLILISTGCSRMIDQLEARDELRDESVAQFARTYTINTGCEPEQAVRYSECIFDNLYFLEPNLYLFMLEDDAKVFTAMNKYEEKLLKRCRYILSTEL